MKEPKHRYSTGEAIDFLAKAFNYRNEIHMQDWEYEVSDPADLEPLVALEMLDK